MGIVTSNAWLDVNYGYELQKFFLSKFKIIAILESRCEPWFTEASVNTVVTILELCDDAASQDAHLVKFVKVKRKLADLIPQDMQVEVANRWSHLEKLVKKIEATGRAYLNARPLGVITEENDDFRIRIRRQGEMLAEVEKTGKTVKWGVSLRAPEVYFDILKTAGKKLTLMKEVALPKRGGLTRINEFFHVTPKIAEEFGIEKEYLWPLIKSPKETSTITVDPASLELKIFVCRLSKEELKRLGHKGALKYIEWGEKQTYSSGPFAGQRWPEGTWVKDRKPGWWALPETETPSGEIFFSEAFGDRHIHKFSLTPLIPDKRLYYLSPSTDKEEILAACLNSSLVSLFVELGGRVTMGDGVLEFSVEDARDYLLLPDVRLFSAKTQKEIIAALQPLLKRPIGPVFEEVKREDWQALDRAVLTALGLDPKKYLRPLYEGLTTLVRERIELGKMRSKARRAKGKKAVQKAEEDVLAEVLPQGPKRFPDDFFPAGMKQGDFDEIELPAEPLRMAGPLFGKEELVTDGGFRYEARNRIEAQYLIYAQMAGYKVVRAPKVPVEVSRAVKNYEIYLRELKATLYEAYYRRTLDQRTATRLTAAAFEKLKLPQVQEA